VKTQRTWPPGTRELLVLALAAAAATGCGGAPQSDAVTKKLAGTTKYHELSGGDIPLLDRTGAPVMRGSTTPVSPEKTCGACHDVNNVTMGYHFQQGRTAMRQKFLATGNVADLDGYNTSKPWLLSDGMYGKW
jgi:hypothetical protein